MASPAEVPSRTNSSGAASPKASRGETLNRGECRPSIVLALCAAGVAIVVLSGLTTRVVEIPLTVQLGLLELLPPSYWLGLSLIGLAAAIAVRTGSGPLVAATGAVLLAILAGTPALFEPTPRYWDAYMHFSHAQDLASSGQLASADPTKYSSNWPGAFLAMWTLSTATGVPALEFLALFPFVVGGITFLAILELLTSTFGAETGRLAAVPTSLFAVWAQYHVSPQALGFILALLFLSTFRRHETKWRACAAILFGGLVLSHPTSAILLITVLATYAIFSLIPRLHGAVPKEEFLRESRLAVRAAFTFSAMWLSWLFFRAVGSAEAARTAIVTRMDQLLGLPEQTLNMMTARTSENLMTVAPIIRSAGIAIYGLFGLLSLVVLFRNRHDRGLFRLVFGVVFAAGFVAAADIFAFRGQFYDRSILLIATFLPGLCFAALKGIRIPKLARRTVMIVFVGASLATASTTYYLEAFNLVPAESIAGADFLDTLPPGAIAVDGMVPHPVWLDPESRTQVVRLTFVQLWPNALENLDTSAPVYVVYDPTSELWYRQWYGTELYWFYADSQSNYSRVYDNGWMEIYSASG